MRMYGDELFPATLDARGVAREARCERLGKQRRANAGAAHSNSQFIRWIGEVVINRLLDSIGSRNGAVQGEIFGRAQ